MNRFIATVLIALTLATAVGVLLFERTRPVRALPGDTVGDRVYGQLGSFTTNTQSCIVYGPISANDLCAPNGIALDPGQSLWIVDTINHRVLQYDSPLTDTTADRVLGQGGSFTTGTCNKGGLSADSLCYPVAVAVDSNDNVYVADNYNHRILQYDDPINTDTTADRVFGQFGSFTGNTFNNGGTSANSLWHPSGVAVDAAGNLFVADRMNYRVLEYDTPIGSGTTADRVYGQFNSMTSGLANNGGVSADSLYELLGVHADMQTGTLYVADAGNNRVLAYQSPMSNSTADLVFGQHGSFTANAVNNSGISASTLYSPTDIDVDPAGNVYITETGNERSLIYHDPWGTDVIADVVLGQGGSFTAAGNNSIGLNASSQADPWAITIGIDCYVWIAELGNNRAIEFDSPPPLCQVQPTFTPTATACPVPVCTATPTATVTPTPTETSTPEPTPTCDGPPPCVPATPTCTTPPPCAPPSSPTPTQTCATGPDGPCYFTATPTCEVPCTATDTPTPTETLAPSSTATVTNTPSITPTPTPPLLDVDLDGCLDYIEVGTNHTTGGQRDPMNYWDFFDVGAGSPLAHGKDGTVDLKDTLLTLQHFGHGFVAGGYPDPIDNDLDRFTPNMMEPWRSNEANNGVDLQDALANLRSFGDSCQAPP